MYPLHNKKIRKYFYRFLTYESSSSFGSIFFLTGLSALLQPYYNSLNYDQYDLKEVQGWFQELDKFALKEDYWFVELLLLIVYKVVKTFFEYRPISFNADKLVNYAHLIDGFSVEEKLKNELYAVKDKLKITINSNVEFSKKKNFVFRKDNCKKLHFVSEFRQKIILIEEELTRLSKMYALRKQCLYLKIILLKNNLENFLEAFTRKTGIESYCIPGINHIKSVVDVLIFCLVNLKNIENKEKLSNQLDELILSFQVEKNELVQQDLDVESLTLKDFYYVSYAVVNTTNYYQCYDAICKFKQDLLRSEGEIKNSILLEILRDIDFKKQKTEVIKNKFFKKNIRMHSVF